MHLQLASRRRPTSLPPGDEAAWQAVTSLRVSLRNVGSELVVRSGRTEDELAKLAVAIGARTVVAEEEARLQAPALGLWQISRLLYHID